MSQATGGQTQRIRRLRCGEDAGVHFDEPMVLVDRRLREVFAGKQGKR